MSKEKSKAELLKEKLFMEKKHAGLIMSESEIAASVRVIRIFLTDPRPNVRLQRLQ